jgi:hypothetical protein
MSRAALAGLAALAVVPAACGAEVVFDPSPFVGTWRGRWIDERGPRGSLDVEISEAAGSLVFACRVGGPGLWGRRPHEEQVLAEVRGGRAVFDGHRSELLGEVAGALDADGSLVVECDDVRGPARSLYGHGTWTPDELVAEVEVRYDDSLRTSRAVVELERRSRD